MNAVDLFPLSTPATTNNGGAKLFFKVTNNSDEVLNLQWVDYNGQLVSYGTVAPHSSRMQEGAQNHSWQLASNDGKVGFKFTINNAAEITIGSNYQPAITDYSEKIIDGPDGLWSSTMGYGVIDVATSLGVAETKYLPMTGQNNYAALNAINAPSAWAAGFTGKGVKVAVVDAGIAQHSELAGKIVGGYDFFQNDNDPTPDNGAYADHALGVAAIIAGSHEAHYGRDTMGVAPDAQLLNVRVGSSEGSGSNAIAAGIRWAVDNGAKVICMPLQGGGDQVDQLVADAIHYAFQHNVVTVVIGGNYSSFTPTGPAVIAQQLKGELIDVGNFDLDSGNPFLSSNLSGANPFPWVMASSTGWVPTTNGNYAYHEDGGTSFAGPYVAGLAALLWQQNPSATAAEIIHKITYGADVSQTQAVADYLYGYLASAGPQTVMAQPGVKYDLGGGVDTIRYETTKSTQDIIHNANGTIEVVNRVDHTANNLTNVERLKFTDTSVALDTGKGELAGEAYRLYQAAFDRTPDQSGLSFWMNQLDHGTTLETVAAEFIKSGEFQKLYGVTPSNTDLVNAMYHNVLHRAPDATGMNFWIDAMNHGVSSQTVLAQFSESAENVAQVATIIGQGFDYQPYA